MPDCRIDANARELMRRGSVSPLQDQALTAQRSALAEQLVAVLAGSQGTALSTWIAHVRDTTRTAPAVLFVGCDELYKTVRDGLAQLWDDEAPVPKATPMLGITRGPLLASDSAHRCAARVIALQNAITGLEHLVRVHKGTPVVHRGAYRVLLAGDKSGADALAAALPAGLLLVLRPERGSVERFLAEVGGAQRLRAAMVGERGLARHALWLAEQSRTPH